TSRRPASKRSTRRFGYDRTLKSSEWAQPPPGPALRLADHRAAIHLGGRRQRYLLGIRGREDIVVRGELLRRHARVEADLHLLPERVEAVALDRIDDAHERATDGKLPLTRTAGTAQGSVSHRSPIEYIGGGPGGGQARAVGGSSPTAARSRPAVRGCGPTRPRRRGGG